MIAFKEIGKKVGRIRFFNLSNLYWVLNRKKLIYVFKCFIGGQVRAFENRPSALHLGDLILREGYPDSSSSKCCGRSSQSYKRPTQVSGRWWPPINTWCGVQWSEKNRKWAHKNMIDVFRLTTKSSLTGMFLNSTTSISCLNSWNFPTNNLGYHYLRDINKKRKCPPQLTRWALGPGSIEDKSSGSISMCKTNLIIHNSGS